MIAQALLSLWLVLTPAPVGIEELDLLAHIVQQEAGNQGLEGQVAVVNVIRNRVQSDRFPDSITGVITSRGQFESYGTGRYKYVKPTPVTWQAVLQGLFGESLVGDAVYFCNYEKIGTKAKRWFDSLEEVDQIGDHRFYK